MRGADVVIRTITAAERRFIPTCVGQIAIADMGRTIQSGSSPHAWGRWPLVSQRQHNGPVHPHMRGADIDCTWRSAADRWFIPTCVGQIGISNGCETACYGSSPHAWGRWKCSRLDYKQQHGSSPHAWGRWLPVYFSHRYNIGSSPHAWGRWLPVYFSHRYNIGSSPHAWGRLLSFRGTERIPPVHPHMRGADFFWYLWHQIFPRFIPTCVGQMKL